jgi:hypothetical protein
MNDAVAGVEFVTAPHVVVPAEFVVADVRPMPMLTVGRAGLVGVAVTLTSPSVAVPVAVTVKGADVSAPPTCSVSVYNDVVVLGVVVVGDVVLVELLQPAATSGRMHARSRAAFMSAFL